MPNESIDELRERFDPVRRSGNGEASSVLQRSLLPGEASFFLTIPLVRSGDTTAAMEEFRSSWEAGYWEAWDHVTRHRSVGRFLKDYAPFAELTRLRD